MFRAWGTYGKQVTYLDPHCSAVSLVWGGGIVSGIGAASSEKLVNGLSSTILLKPVSMVFNAEAVVHIAMINSTHISVSADETRHDHDVSQHCFLDGCVELWQSWSNPACLCTTNFNKALTKPYHGLIESLLSIDFWYQGKWLNNKKILNLDIYLKAYFNLYLIVIPQFPIQKWYLSQG